MPVTLSRRNFLRAAAGAGAAAAFGAPLTRALAFPNTAQPGERRLAQVPNPDPASELLSYIEVFNNPPMLGRVHGAVYVRRFAEPRPDAPSAGDNIQTLQVVPIL